MFVNRIRAGAGGFVLATLAAIGAQAQDAEPYSLDGETIRLLVSQAAGGNTDSQTRLLGDFLARYLPGEPSIVVQNIIGGSGIRMLEYVRQLDLPDDLVMYVTSASMPFQALVGGIDPDLFDPRTVNWIGSFRGSTQFCIVSTASGIETVEDMIGTPLLFASASAGGTASAMYTLMSESLGFEIETVAGYDSFGAQVLAVERGEVDGMCNNYSGYASLARQAVEAGQAKFIFYMGEGRRDDITEAPYLGDLAVDPDGMAFVESALSAILFSGFNAVPAGSDPRFVEALRTAFLQVLADPEFQAAAANYGVDLKVQTAADVEARVADLYALSPEAIALIGRFFGE